MRTILFGVAALLLWPGAASAQVNEQASMASCKAPVAIDNKDCSDVLGAGAPSGTQGSIEQRDDGYYVFVPYQGD